MEVARPAVEVRRSRRRRRTVSAYRDDDGTVVVLIPASMSGDEEAEWVTAMVGRLARSEERRSLSDEDLARRARSLSERYLEGLARPDSVRWVDNQQQRWGSCTPADRSIRLSTRLRGMPPWVVDYVLVHELAHLLVSGHSPAFWRLVDRYPRTERARGFLEGLVAGRREAAGEPDLDSLVHDLLGGVGGVGSGADAAHPVDVALPGARDESQE